VKKGIADVSTHDYEKFAGEYAGFGIEGTNYLAFRDIPAVIAKRLKGKNGNALDYGCGPGRSTRFLKSLGLDVTGVDVSEDMLKHARAHDETGDYRLIKSERLPFNDGSFDLVFSSFVFLEVSSLDEITRIAKEMKRVLKPSGTIVIVTAPNECYTGNWVSLSYDFPENRRAVKSGETVKLLFKGTNVVLYDYYWTEQDYERVFAESGLPVADTLRPLGRPDDPISWLDEANRPAALIYVLGHKKTATKPSPTKSQTSRARHTRSTPNTNSAI
jgi:ubiquinone/menaquinone biosynthesis C-methylase UbiE